MLQMRGLSAENHSKSLKDLRAYAAQLAVLQEEEVKVARRPTRRVQAALLLQWAKTPML